MKGKACAPVRESTWMSPDWEHRRNKQEHRRGRARLLPRSYKVYGGCLEFARQRKRDNELKKQWRQKWGRKSKRGEEETRSGGDMDTSQRVSVLWTSDLQAAKLLCVHWESEPHCQWILPSLLLTRACHHYTSPCSLQVSHSFPQVISLQFRKEGWRASDTAINPVTTGCSVSHNTGIEGAVITGKQRTWTYSELTVNTASQESGPRTGDTSIWEDYTERAVTAPGQITGTIHRDPP